LYESGKKNIFNMLKLVVPKREREREREREHTEKGVLLLNSV